MKKTNIIIKKHKKKILIALSFIIPLIIYTTIFYINGLLTNKTIISGDMYAQYYPLFNYLKGIFEGTNSIFYSFSKGLGGTMFGTIFYYMSSPLNLLLIIIDKQNIPQFITYLIILKLSLCGLTMYLYMRKKYKEDNAVLLVFSLLYAFMGYNLNYFINIMWLDVVIMAPLVLIGIEKILEDKSPSLYITTLFISILSNYYISYMLCIFCVLYYIYEILLKYNIKQDKQIIKKITKKFIISSLLSGLMCSFFLIPCIYEMTNYGRGVDIKEILVFDYNFFDLFSKTYIGTLNLNNTLNYTSMNLYCSIIVIPLVYIFITNKKNSKKERIYTLLLIIIMIMPCFIKIFNYVWHLFTVPFFYSFRYSFLLCLFLISISYKSYKNLKIEKNKLLLYMILYLIISFYFIILTNFTNYYSFLNYKLILITLIFLTSYFTILIKTKNNKTKNTLIITLILIENILNISIIFGYSTFNEKDNFKYAYEKIIRKYDKNLIEISNDYSYYNNSLIYKYRGINTFLSTINYRNIEFLSLAGYNETDFTNLYIFNNQSPIIDTIIGPKIIISDEQNSNVGYELKTTIDNKYIYENKSTLGIGYIIKNECNNMYFEFPYDQKIFECITGEKEQFYKEVPLKSNVDDEYIYETEKDTLYYIYTNSDDDIFDDNKDDLIYQSTNYYILKSNDNTLKIDLKKSLDKNIKVYFFDYKKYKKTLDKIIIEQLDYDIEKNKLKGKINTNGGILMIKLPYEKGFKIYVNNELKEYKKVLNTFIGVELGDGESTILVEYHQPGLKLGIIISILSIFGCIIYISTSREKKVYEKKI